MLSTKNIPSASGMSKSILPGEKVIKINFITLDTVPYNTEAYHVTLHCETEPIDGLDGFFIDKDDPSKGKYLGQIGRVKASMYPFANGVTKSGIKIERDRTILQFLKNLSCELGIFEYFDSLDNRFNTIEEFVEHFNRSKKYQNIWINAVIGGKEYDKNGYTNYDLFLPKFDKTGKPIKAVEFTPEEASSSPMVSYDPTLHIKKSAKTTNAPVDSFESSFPVSSSVGNDFEL